MVGRGEREPEGRLTVGRGKGPVGREEDGFGDGWRVTGRWVRVTAGEREPGVARWASQSAVRAAIARVATTKRLLMVWGTASSCCVCVCVCVFECTRQREFQTEREKN